jgi:hypothetical protein
VGPFHHGRRVVPALLLSAALLSACTEGLSGGGSGRFPPPPATPRQDLGPDQPPVIWLGGTLTEVSEAQVVLRQPAGSVVALRRLAGDATSFFRFSGSEWQPVPAGAPVSAGQAACVETLLDRETLLALRVFVGAGCGPA